MFKGSRRKISMVLVVAFLVTMVLPMSAWGATTSKKFSDVGSNHWARQQISRMNYRGIIMGYEDGTVKPDSSVTQFEAIVMATRLMGLAEKIGTVGKGDYLPVTVPTWSGARETAVVAYNAGLIDEKDFKYNQSASREWVAKLLVKVLGKEKNLNDVAGEYLAFSDANKIGSEYLSYVKMASSLGLVSGYADGTFKPQNKVSRAEMAAFLVRAEDQMTVSANNLLIGSVTAISGINVEITSSAGMKKNLYVMPNSTALYNEAGKSIAVTDLAVGTPVYALYADDTLLNYLEVQTKAVVPPTPEVKPVVANIAGTVTKVIVDKNTLVVTAADGTLSTVIVNATTKITADGSTNALTFGDISLNDQVKIVSNNQIASQIIIASKGTTYTQSGTIFDVDVYGRLIIMQQSDGLKTYKMAKEMTVSIAGMLTATASNLKVGDKASFEIEKGEMTAIAVGGSGALFDGMATIMELNTASKFMTYKGSDGALKANYYDNNTTVSFGGEKGKITDLQAGDMAKITVSNNKVTSIVVENRKLAEGYKGTVYAVDQINSILTFKDGDGNLKTYPVSSTAAITLYEQTAYLSSVKKDMNVEIGLSAGVITMIKANNKISGTVVSVNAANNYLELRPDNNTAAVGYNVSPSVVIYDYNEVTSRLRSIGAGDQITMKVENNRVTEIELSRRIDYLITDTYSTSSTRVEVKEGNHTPKDLYISSDVILVVPGTTNPRVRDLHIGDQLIATYVGNTLTKVEVSTKVVGTVTGLNATTKMVTVSGYDGKSYQYQFDNDSSISKDGYTYNDFSRLSVNDKLYVTEGADKGRCFSILQSRTAKLGVLQASMIFVQNSAKVGDWMSYPLDKNAYLHQGNNVLTISNFKLDDMVTIYYADKTVYEVIKL